MYKRKTCKLISILLTLCIIFITFSGSAMHAEANESDITAEEQQARNSTAITSMPFVFRHFYDSETFSSKQYYINSAVSFVNQVYSYNFPATALSTTDYPVAPDTISGLGNCTTETPCLSALGCGGYGDHHKDIGKIANNLYAWRTSNYGTNNENIGQIVVLWTDYESGVYCYYHFDEYTNRYVHENVNYLACVFDYRPVIHIMNIDTWNSSHYAPHMGILLAHELAHCIGLDDQYELQDGATHAPDDEMNCIMDYFASESIASDGSTAYPAVEFRNRIVANYNLAFCSDCRGALRYLIDDWVWDYNYYVEG